MDLKTPPSKTGNIVAFLHTILIYLWVVVATVVFGTTAIVVSFFSKTGDSVHHVARMWGRSILWVSRIKVHISGLENIDPNRSAIYMSNHQSNFDIPVYFSALPVQFRWLAKAELFKIPIFGQGMRGAGYISIDRSNRKSAMASLSRAAESIRKGTSILLFPEGTRSRDGQLHSFKSGGFILSVDSGALVVPMAVQGTFGIMPKNSKIIRPQTVRVVVGKPIDAAAFDRHSKNDLIEHVRGAILDAMAAAQVGGGRA